MKPQQQKRFLEALAACPNVSAAARAAGFSRQAAYEKRKNDPGFAEAWDGALGIAVDSLEAEAFKRATHPWVASETFDKDGKIVSRTYRVSDSLVALLLKAHKPDPYARPDRIAIDEGQEDDGKVDAAAFRKEVEQLERERSAERADE